MWAKTYPRNGEPYGNLGVDYTYLGQYEKAVAASLEDLRLNPGSAAAFTNLVGLYAALDRLDDAKTKYQGGRRAQGRQSVSARQSLWRCFS